MWNDGEAEPDRLERGSRDPRHPVAVPLIVGNFVAVVLQDDEPALLADLAAEGPLGLRRVDEKAELPFAEATIGLDRLADQVGSLLPLNARKLDNRTHRSASTPTPSISPTIQPWAVERT